MVKQRFRLPRTAALLFSYMTLLAAIQPVVHADDNVLAEVEGLWTYTDLVTSDDESLPLTGIFLLANGYFLQQSIFDGEPFEAQDAMAHAGRYRAGGAGLRMTSDPTLSFRPAGDFPHSDAGAMDHDIAVNRKGDQLILQFGAGSGTIQVLEQIGEAEDAVVYTLEDGAFALADGHFIIVNGDEERAVSGYGTYEREGEALALRVERWAESDGETVENRRGVRLKALFDGDTLVLPDGRGLAVREQKVTAP